MIIRAKIYLQMRTLSESDPYPHSQQSQVPYLPFAKDWFIRYTLWQLSNPKTAPKSFSRNRKISTSTKRSKQVGRRQSFYWAPHLSCVLAINFQLLPCQIPVYLVTEFSFPHPPSPDLRTDGTFWFWGAARFGRPSRGIFRSHICWNRWISLEDSMPSLLAASRRFSVYSQRIILQLSLEDFTLLRCI